MPDNSNFLALGGIALLVGLLFLLFPRLVVEGYQMLFGRNLESRGVSTSASRWTGLVFVLFALVLIVYALMR